jgi:multicomponent Na+:H+ antiporter subunit E
MSRRDTDPAIAPSAAPRRWLSVEVARALLVRGVVFAVVWWAIVEGRPVGWYFAVIAVAAATALSVAIYPPGRWTLRGVLRFIPYFLVESVRGGLDVALRAFRPGPQVTPDFIEYEFTGSDPQVRLLVANAMSLMPGTLAARVHDHSVIVHLLDVTSSATRIPAELDARVNAMVRVRRPAR